MQFHVLAVGILSNFDLALLLKGEAFECSQCHSRISLTPQSRPIVAEASARLEELKQKASRQLDEKPENP